VRLGQLADQSTPVLADLDANANDIDTLIQRLGPFSQAAIPAVNSLGEAAKKGTPAVIASRPVITDLRKLANAVRPVGATARQVLQSFQQTHGIERLMDYIFYQVAAINGFDAVGHYLRAELMVNQCATYAVRPVAGCSANFPQTGASSSAAVATAAQAAASDDPVLQRTAEALQRALGIAVEKAKRQQKTGAKHKRHPAKKHAKKAKKARPKVKRGKPSATATPGATAAPAVPVPTAVPQTAATPAAPAAGGPSATATPTPTTDPSQALLDYLFGKGP
jgi:phospholipid/cholesterol/gamma-HCH transport system substrate-binding protein